MKFIRMKLAMFGRISPNTTRIVPRSSSRAASTNSRSFSENTWARTARVSTGQDRPPTSSASRSGESSLKNAPMTASRTICGTVRKTSVSVTTTESTQPPRYAASDPSTIAMRGRDRRGDEADEDHRPAAVDHLDQDVLALVVGAERVPGDPAGSRISLTFGGHVREEERHRSRLISTISATITKPMKPAGLRRSERRMPANRETARRAGRGARRSMVVSRHLVTPCPCR